MSRASHLVLRPRQWYGWIMLPGYAGPHCAPVFVRQVEPLGTGRELLRVFYIDPFYAEGVQHFQQDLRVLHRTPTHLVAAIDGQPDRSGSLSELDGYWLRGLCPTLASYVPEAGNTQALLSRLFPGAVGASI
jgi:hypothetical protein